MVHSICANISVSQQHDAMAPAMLLHHHQEQLFHREVDKFLGLAKLEYNSALAVNEPLIQVVPWTHKNMQDHRLTTRLMHNEHLASPKQS
jgi:hypothetical protein